MKMNAKVARGWARHPNLRRRLAKPALGRGRLQVAIERAFIVGGPVVSASSIYDWAYPHDRRRVFRHSVIRILRQVAEPVERANTSGRPWLWRLKTAGG
jgi:hypothetical protein